MRWVAFKIIMFLAACLFVQGAILPWVISNNILPIWMDILFLGLLLFIFGLAIEKIANKLSAIAKDWDERKID
jgi:hypothetical protein